MILRDFPHDSKGLPLSVLTLYTKSHTDIPYNIQISLITHLTQGGEDS